MDNNLNIDIILASSSPRRRELLSMLGLRGFRVIPAGDEPKADGLPPAEAAGRIALAKADSVAASNPGAAVIAADTIVELEGRIFGKPRDEADAARMLTALSGREHRVYTGVAVKRGESTLCETERTVVRFREIDRREIEAYIKSGEPMDKAGAYGAQGLGSLLITGIEGDFFNVMGLPLCRLSQMLKKLGVTIL